MFDGLTKFFDPYSLGARVLPALLALFPVFITIGVLRPNLYSTAAAFVSLMIGCGLVTFLAHFTRHRGRKIEARLISNWGGWPSTIWLRYSSTFLDEFTKARYCTVFELNITDWVRPTEAEEVFNPDEVDRKYGSAVRWLIEQTRDSSKYSLLLKENISYGFRRNCLGIKSYAIFLLIITISVCLYALSTAELELLFSEALAEVVNLILLILMLLWWIFIINPQWVRDAGDAYAKALLSSCENL